MITQGQLGEVVGFLFWLMVYMSNKILTQRGIQEELSRISLDKLLDPSYNPARRARELVLLRLLHESSEEKKEWPRPKVFVQASETSPFFPSEEEGCSPKEKGNRGQ